MFCAIIFTEHRFFLSLLLIILSIKIPVYKIGKFTSFRFNNEINRGNKYKQNQPILARLRFLDKQKSKVNMTNRQHY